jgi:hypothetical protein
MIQYSECYNNIYECLLNLIYRWGKRDTSCKNKSSNFLHSKKHAVATEERTKNTDAEVSLPYGKLITVTYIVTFNYKQSLERIYISISMTKLASRRAL